MAERIDQIFVLLKQWLVGLAPADWQPIISVLISVLPIFIVFPSLFAITTLLERKGLGRIQNRYGPNRVGPFGLLQPAADGLKALTKEDVVPRAADKVVHFIAPLVLVVPAFLVYAVLPFGRNMVVTDLEAGVLFFFAVGAATEFAVFMAGWSSRNKYSLLGAMRAIAQMISYEIPLILSAVSVIMIVGSLSTVSIVDAQGGYQFGLPNWFVLTPWGFAGFVLFMIAATAESNRAPFDLPEGESEIIAGYYIEYSGFKFALFFLGEYLGLFAVSGLAITLFLGGWHAPLPFLQILPSWFWFFAKLLGLIALFVWVRGTLPRLRMDQLMNFAWKFMLPMALINLVVAAIWPVRPAGSRPDGRQAPGTPHVSLCRMSDAP
jgi:NADH-quinone oxidoreductase subunit H